ncbi:zf-HC2 domain-containing protein [bacterium]|nr:zf-HC2 domain-containing protein [bacterium]
MSELNCDRCQDLLLDYDEGFLSADEAASVSSHLQGCEACSLYLKELKKNWEDLAEAFPAETELEPAADYRLRFWKRVGQEEAEAEIVKLRGKAERKGFFSGYRGLAAAAAAAFIFGGVCFWGVGGNLYNGAGSGPVASKPAAETSAEAVSAQSEAPDGDDSFESYVYAEYNGEWDDIMSQELLDSAFDDICDAEQSIRTDAGGRDE